MLGAAVISFRVWARLGGPRSREAARAALQDLPDDDRIRSFDAYRTHLQALPEAIAAASGGSAPKGIRTPDLHLERVAS